MGLDLLTRQVVVAGRITDALTGGPLRARPALTLRDEATGRLADLAVRLAGVDLYAVSGDPAVVLPPQDTVLRLEVAADGYAPATRSLAFAAAGLARVERVVTLGDRAVAALVVQGLPRTEDVALTPLPVALRGRVGRAESPDEPVAGAVVQVTAPEALGPFAADANGYFTIPALPVASAVTLLVAAPGRIDATVAFEPDHARPTNSASFILEPSS